MLEINHLRFKRGTFLLEVPQLTIERGMTLLVGKNGAGKSTLLQLLATALFPQEGEILYEGKSPERDLALIRSQIGFLPTGIRLYEGMDVRRFLRYMAALKGGGKEEADSLLHQFSLTHVAKRKIEGLPQGFKQRLAIAQALIGNPQYLFLDEPFNALDTLERMNLYNNLIRYSRDHLLLISTHDPSGWENLTDRILRIDDGRILS